MPATITATPVEHAGVIQVDIDWPIGLDGYLSVQRVNQLTGEAVYLHPHTSYENGAQQLSGGTARMVDTDVPIDTPVYYRIVDADGASWVGSMLYDLYTRSVSPGWGNSTGGEAWTTTGGLGTDHSVNGTKGVQSLGTVNVRRLATIPLAHTDGRAAADVELNTGAILTQPAVTEVWVRAASANDHYFAALTWAVADTVTLSIGKRVGGVATTFASTQIAAAFAADQQFRVEIAAIGYTITAKAWAPAGTEPGWQLTAYDTAHASGTLVGLSSILTTGNTNALPVLVRWDNFGAVGTSTTAPTLTRLPSGGKGWLRDPLRPCHNVRVELCARPPCPSPDGGFEDGGSGWTATAGTITASTAVAFDGQRVGLLTASGAATPRARMTPRLTVAPGRWVLAAGWLMAPVALPSTATLTIEWYNAAGTLISAAPGGTVTLTAGAWTYRTMLALAPALTASAQLVWGQDGTPAGGTLLYGDLFSLAPLSPGNEGGVFFAGMDPETRDPNSQNVNPVNRALAVAVTRPRRGVESTLTLVSASFEARDALVDLLAPGGLVVFDYPAEYGIPQRFLSVGTTAVERRLSDHRFEPRVHALPVVQAERPEGPTEGTCGAQWGDGCLDPTLDTWAEVQAAGLTYDQLIEVR